MKLALATSKYTLQKLPAALDLFNKVKKADSKIPPDVAKDRW